MLSDQYSSSDLIYEAIANKELDLEEYGIYGSRSIVVYHLLIFCHIPMLMKAVPCLSQREKWNRILKMRWKSMYPTRKRTNRVPKISISPADDKQSRARN